MTNYTRAGCGVVLVNDNDEFLIMKRNSKHATDTYAIVGGWIDFGETPEEAAAREVMEEVGVEVKDLQLLGVTTNPFPKENIHAIAPIIGARIKSGIPTNMEPHKCAEMMWMKDWENLPRPLLTEYNKFISKKVVDDYIANTRSR